MQQQPTDELISTKHPQTQNTLNAQFSQNQNEVLTEQIQQNNSKNDHQSNIQQNLKVSQEKKIVVENHNRIQQHPKEEQKPNNNDNNDGNKEKLEGNDNCNLIQISQNIHNLKASFLKILSEEKALPSQSADQSQPQSLSPSINQYIPKQFHQQQANQISKQIHKQKANQNQQKPPKQITINNNDQLNIDNVRKSLQMKTLHIKKQKLYHDGQWSQYLKTAYQHYCKSTYATGQCPTFQYIYQTVHSMNINTFMAFCRNFGIMLSRLKIIQIFKKSTNFSSHMSFSQFLKALLTMSHQIFGGPTDLPNQSQEQQNNNYECRQFQRLINLLHINSQTAFHNKMVQIGIKQRRQGMNAHQNLIKPQPQCSYQYKINPHNGRNLHQIQQQLQTIKSNKAQKKLTQIQHQSLAKKRQIKQFQKLQKMSYSYKKVTAGGYMSPHKNPNPQNSKQFFNNYSKNLSSSNQSINPIKPRTKNNIRSPPILSHNQSNGTSKVSDQLNLSNNFLHLINQPSIEASNVINNNKININNSINMHKGVNSYFVKHKIKNNQLHQQRINYKNQQVNSIIKLARLQQKQSPIYSQINNKSAQLKPQIHQFISNQSNISNNKPLQSPDKTISQIQKPQSLIPIISTINITNKISVSLQKQQSQLELLIGNLEGEQTDEFLRQHLKISQKQRTKLY